MAAACRPTLAALYGTEDEDVEMLAAMLERTGADEVRAREGLELETRLWWRW